MKTIMPTATMAQTGELILDSMRSPENDERMTINSVDCEICDKVVLFKDSYVCQDCGKTVCEEHSSLQGQSPDWYIVCTDCCEEE